MKKHFTAHIIFAATALASQQAWALGFGRAVSDAVLGQAFTFTVPVNVEPGERFGLDCVSTQVYYGESQLLPTAVRTDLERGAADNTWIVRITANVPVSEPIVEVALSAGCERRFTRRFSVFADPPTLAATAPSAAETPFVPVAPARASDSPHAFEATPSAAPAATVAGAHGAHGAHRAAAPASAGGRPRVVRKGPTMALANELNTPASARHAAAEPARAPRPGPRVPAPAAPGDIARLVLDPGVPHLKLDMEEPVIPPPSGAASGAALGLAELDDADTRQLKALEQSLQSARRERQTQRDQAAQLQAQLADAQSRGDWLPWLLVLLAIAVAAIAALLWKLRQQSRIAHSDWFNQSQFSPPAPEPPPPAPAPRPSAPVAAEPRARALPAAAPVLADEVTLDLPGLADDARGAVVADPFATRPLDRQVMAAAAAQDGSPRELSVEELLDLEQQADFFIALGQEDAAIDLLMSHLRSAGGQSPLPYTKLLEIYKRQGDRSAYERTRARFNRRFNAYAPDWDTGPTAGRSLEDYPDTVAQLEATWHSPIDAMAILESLLFKRDEASEVFDLPAYRDVLVLYSLARDLWQNGGSGHAGTQVDVLLPLDDSARTRPMPIYPSAREVNDRALPANDPGLDLDSVDVEGDTRQGLLTSFEMSDPLPEHEGGRVDFELPHVEDLDLPHVGLSHLDLPIIDRPAQGLPQVDAPSPAGPALPGDAVHLTLDELSLTPVAPTPGKSSPLDWDEGETPDSELPTRR